MLVRWFGEVVLSCEDGERGLGGDVILLLNKKGIK